MPNFTGRYEHCVDSNFQTINGQSPQVNHVRVNASNVTSGFVPNTAHTQKPQDSGVNMVPYTGLGKRRRSVADVGNKSTAEKVADSNPGRSISPVSSLTNISSTPMLPSERPPHTNRNATNGFTKERMPPVRANGQPFDIFDNQYIKSTLSSPKKLPNTPPLGVSPESLDAISSSSPKSLDGGKIRGSKRRIEKEAKPNSSIPQSLSWAEYARQCSLAAYASRLNPFALSLGEDRLLKDHIDPVQVTTYLNIRNGILRLWTRNPLVSVTTDEAFGCAKQERYFGLALVAYQWLMRNGYINYGCVEIPTAPNSVPRTKSKGYRRPQVVIIGAGMSGLGCARHLQGLFAQMEPFWRNSHYGGKPPQIVVLEARRRLGGRVYSHPLRTQAKGSLPGGLRNTAELGAHIITGFEYGNPLNAIIRGQLGLRYHGLRDNSILYDCDGSVVDKERDDSIQKLYNDVLERVCTYRHKANLAKTLEGDRDLMLVGRDPSSNQSDRNGKGLGTHTRRDAAKVASHDQMAQRDKASQHVAGGLEKLAGKAYQVSGTGAKNSATDAAKAMGWVAKEGISDHQSLELDDFVSSSTRPTLGATMDEAIQQYQSIINLTPQDMRLLNWHHANLEYSNAANVNELSLSGWDQDTGNEFEGEHSQIIGGYIQVPKALQQLPYPLDVRFGSEVVGINYEPGSGNQGLAKVICANGEKLEADQVVLTTPLGVIKENSIKFSPPLPDWKSGVIERLGFGLLNKVVLVYEKAFWDEDRDMFGLLNQSASDGSLDPSDYSAGRGRFYLFWNCIKTSGRPVLIALMAGEAAHQTEKTENSELIREVTARLSKICAPLPVPAPSEVIVTRWQKDPWARGTYSYVGPEGLPGDYDVMAKPVGNLHFAGEATCGTHPATVHGAYLSGLRAASEVIDAMMGPIPIPHPLIQTYSKPESVSVSASKPKSTVDAVPAPPGPSSGAFDRGNPEAMILEAIFQQLGERPLKPIKEGTNPFLLYTKDKWSECKAACEEKRRTASKRPDSKASKDEIRIALGKMWRQASAEEKKPYQDQAEIRKQMTTSWMDEWKRKTEEWDREAARIRKQFTDSKPQFGDQGAQLRAHLDATAGASRGSNGALPNGKVSNEH
ncbi:MAG: hypothetical protein M1822_002476 [Bathelium mastoideum]|nr:MAG: hypothetical protein M1822_002476 [Bathelium mastoideum]